MLKLNHKKLTVWKKCIELVKTVYFITKTFPKEELFGITSQLRRASVSVPSNIAEEASRKSTVERARFFEIARSSLVEIDTQIEISLELDYLTKRDIIKLDKLSNEVFAMLSAMT